MSAPLYRKAVEPNGRLGFEVYWPGFYSLYISIPAKRVCFVEMEEDAKKAVDWLTTRAAVTQLGSQEGK